LVEQTSLLHTLSAFTPSTKTQCLAKYNRNAIAISKQTHPMSTKELPPLRHCFIGEVIGTFILIFFGCGAVHAAVLWGAQSGLWQVAIVWGVAIMLAIHAVGAVSGAHINPAITIAMFC